MLWLRQTPTSRSRTGRQYRCPSSDLRRRRQRGPTIADAPDEHRDPGSLSPRTLPKVARWTRLSRERELTWFQEKNHDQRVIMAARNRRGMLLAVVARKTRWSRMSMSSSSRGPRWWWMVGRSSRRRCRSPGSGTGRSYLAGGGGGGAGAGAWAEGMTKDIRNSNQGTGLAPSPSPKRFLWRGRVWEHQALGGSCRREGSSYSTAV
jgi:hypothetical protein